MTRALGRSTSDRAQHAAGQSDSLPEIRVFRGASIWARRPIIRFAAPPALAGTTSGAVPGFDDALLGLLPGLRQHPCSPEAPGGFVARLAGGTTLAHVASHVALELQVLAGVSAPIGETCPNGRGDPGDVMYEYSHEAVGREAGELAAELVARLSSGAGSEVDLAVDLATHLEHLSGLAAASVLQRYSREMVDAAAARGIPFIELDKKWHRLIQLGHGVHQKRIRTTTTSRTSFFGVTTALDKALTLELLRAAGVPVPRSGAVTDAEAAVAVAASIGWPVVVKPRFGKQGLGVSIGLRAAREVTRAFAKARRDGQDGHVVVEQQLMGRDFRVLIIGGEVVAVTERVPAHVVGDGEHTVQELVSMTNSDPRRGVGADAQLTLITLGPESSDSLRRQGLTLASVPEAGRRVQLRMTANMATGGSSIDRTDEIHPLNRLLARIAAETVGLDVAGVDIITPDIGAPLHEVGGAVLEVNSSPGTRMHTDPSEGQPRDIHAAYFDLLFPNGSDGRIPIIAVAGATGTTSTVRLIAHILREMGRAPGTATKAGMTLQGWTISTADLSGREGAGVVLRDPLVDAAVLEVDPESILHEGLGYDRNDVAVVRSPRSPLPGPDAGWTSDERSLAAKVMVEAVPPSGTAVLDADDPMTRRLALDCPGSVLLVAARGSVDEHCRRGGRAMVAERSEDGGRLVLRDGEARLPIVETGDIPALGDAPTRDDVADVLAAAAAAWVVGARPEEIQRGLRTFEREQGS